MFRIRIILMMSVLIDCSVSRSQYIFNNISESKGLSSNLGICLLKDRQGFVWVGTINGLNRFDGSTVEVFVNDSYDSSTISDNNIKSIYEARNGDIWVSTRNGGINVFDPKTLAIKHFQYNSNDTASLPGNFINFVFEDRKGRLWVSCQSKGICLFDQRSGTFTNYDPVTQIDGLISRLGADILCYALDPADNDRIWFGSQQGILLFDAGEKKWSHFVLDARNAENPEFVSENEQIIRTLMFSEDGCLWAGTWGGGLLRFNRETLTFRIYFYEPMHPVNGIRNNIRKLSYKDEDHMWVVIPNKGVAVFDIRTGVFDFLYDPENKDSFLPVPFDLEVDSLGFMFIASLSRGLYYTNLKSHQFEKRITGYNLTDIELSADGTKLFGACYRLPGALLVYDLVSGLSQYHDYMPVVDIGENLFVKIERAGNEIWLVENNSLYTWDSLLSKIKPYRAFNPESWPKQANHPHYFISSAVDHKGRIWLGTKYSGLFIVDPNSGETTHLYEPDKSFGNIRFEEWIFSLYKDSHNRMWYGSGDFGYFDPGIEKFVNFNNQRDLKDCPVAIKKVNAFTETPDGNIWLGTDADGIAVIHADNNMPAFVEAYNKRNGLPDNQILDLLCDKQGNVWVVTVKGLAKIDTETGNVSTYDHFSGIGGIDEMTMNDSGEIFIGGGGGFYWFDPLSVRPFAGTDRPYIKSFRVFDREIFFDDLLAERGFIELKYFEDFVSFEYGTVDYFQAGQTRFYHMLDGLDEDWQDAGNRKYISYTNLKGGKYTFRLKTSKGGELSLPLRISTPFWETLWFYLLVALAITGFLMAIHRYRLMQIRRQEELKAEFDKKISQLEVRALRAQMNPHFLFNSLNSIRYYILKNQNRDASEYITKFSRLLRLILRNSRQNQVTLADELHALKIYMEFEQVRFSRVFDFEINIEESVDPEKIMIQPMIIQPFVENAIWHGLMPSNNGRKLKIDVFRVEKNLKIVIEDNGIGRRKAALRKKDELAETKSYGLQITEDRMNLMKRLEGKNSGFVIIDLYDRNNHPAGTRVEITIDI